MGSTGPTPPPAWVPAGYGLGIGPDGTYTRGGQVIAFLCGLWTMVLFFPLLLPGALLYAKVEEVYQTDPHRARTLMVWSWLCLSIFPLLMADALLLVLTLADVNIMKVVDYVLAP